MLIQLCMMIDAYAPCILINFLHDCLCSCNTLYKITNDKYITQRDISIGEINEQALIFFDGYTNSGNLEAICWSGIVSIKS